MKISFHPQEVRTPSQIAAAKRFRETQKTCRSLETLFLAMDNHPQDHHDDHEQVSGRFRDRDSIDYHGYVSSSGTIDVKCEGRNTESAFHLRRSRDGALLEHVRLRGDVAQEKETFRTDVNGTVHYVRQPLVDEMRPTPQLRFLPGSVDSPDAVVAKERYDYLQGFVDRVGSAVLPHDQSQCDLNNSLDELAVLERPMPHLKPTYHRPRHRFLETDIMETFRRAQNEQRLASEPHFTGYYAKDGGIDATLNWNFQTSNGMLKSESEMHRTDDRSSVSLQTKRRTPVWNSTLTVYGRENKLETIQEDTQKLNYHTDQDGWITVEMSHSTLQLDPGSEEKKDWWRA